jgi:CMP/dCMP kinase
VKGTRLGKPSIIAIDGTAASGKSTIGNLLAIELEYVYFDTGVLYRAVTAEGLRRGTRLDDESAVTELAASLSIAIEAPTVKDGRQYTIIVDGRDVTWEIRSDAVDTWVSPVSAYAGVRRVLLEQQRRLARLGGLVMVGRDIGTVVLPEADLKVFLDASIEERARRRTREMESRGISANYDEVLSAMQRRDRIDSGRAVAPLAMAPDAVYLDTEGLAVDTVMQKVLGLVESWRRAHCQG